MPSEFVTSFANDLRSITKKLEKQGVTQKFINLAQKGNEKKLERAMNELKKKKSYLREKLDKLRDKYNLAGRPYVFGFGKDVVNYEKVEIESISLFVLCLLTYRQISPYNLFEDIEIFTKSLAGSGYEQIASYLAKTSYLSLDFFIEAFKS